MNDLPQITAFNTTLFADDACLIMSSYDAAELQSQVNSELLKVSSAWLSSVKLCLNYQKTVFLKITKKSLTTKLDIKIDNYNITEINETKYLGVIIDKKNSWEPQINQTAKKMAN